MARMGLSFVIVAVSAIPSDADLGAMYPIFATGEDHHMPLMHLYVLQLHAGTAVGADNKQHVDQGDRRQSNSKRFEFLCSTRPATGCRKPPAQYFANS